jgi:hypothetical protein
MRSRNRDRAGAIWVLRHHEDQVLKTFGCRARGCREYVAALVIDPDLPRRGVVLRVSALLGSGPGPRGSIGTAFAYKPPGGSASGDLQLEHLAASKLEIRCSKGHRNALDLVALRSVAAVLQAGKATGQDRAQDP